MCNRVSRRPGFTLVELLVVIAIIGMLTAMLIPAVNVARRLAQRMQCSGNMRSIGQALLTHQTGNGTLPPGVPNCSTDMTDMSGSAVCQGPNWLGLILGNLDEQKAYDRIMDCLDMDEVGNVCAQCPKLTDNVETEVIDGVGTTTPSVLRCPSAPELTEEYNLTALGLENLAKGNYAACFGAMYFYNEEDISQDGVFGVVQLKRTFSSASSDMVGRWKAAHKEGIKTDQILDGATKTIMVSEILGWRSPADGRGAWLWSGMGGASFTTFYSPNADGSPNETSTREPEPDTFTACDEQDPEMVGNRMFCAMSEDPAQAWVSARSAHSGGVLACKADNSVDFYSESIDLPVWHALGTTRGPSNEVDPGIDQ